MIRPSHPTTFSAWRICLLVLILLPGLCGLFSGTAQAQSSQPVVLLLTASGALTPAMAGYLERGIQAAEAQGASAIIFQLNTPGGNVTLMNRMVQSLRASRVPVIVYVAPRGAMAASAGTVITLAGHVAAMAPETTIGAASPVDQDGKDLTTTMQAKVKNELKATVRSLSEHRSIEAIRLAEETIEKASAVSSSEALAAGLVDLVASDVPDLLRQLDGRQITTEHGTVTLQTSPVYISPFPPSLIEQVLGMLTNPNIVLILMNVGVIAILFEITSPGGWVAGVIGVVCLALSGYGLGILPVNWFGAVFIIMAFVLFILDIKAPTHGALTAAGVGSLMAGGLILFNSPGVPDFQRVSVPLVVGSALMTGALFFGVLIFAIRAQSAPIRTGVERLIGQEGVTQSELAPDGIVLVGSEQWSAEVVGPRRLLAKGTRVRVLRVEGLKVFVEAL